jgi:hypothetical protein
MSDAAQQEAQAIKSVLTDHGAGEALNRLHQDMDAFAKDPSHSPDQTRVYWHNVEQQLMANNSLPSLSVEWGREAVAGNHLNALTPAFLEQAISNDKASPVDSAMADQLFTHMESWKNNPSLSSEEGDSQAQQVWKAFLQDPTKVPDFKDPAMVDHLMKNLPDELKNNWGLMDQKNALLFSDSKHTAKEFEDAAKHLEVTAAFDKWLQNAASQPNASKTVRDMVENDSRYRDDSLLDAAQYHTLVASNSFKVSDADSLTDKDRADQNNLAKKDLIEQVDQKSSHFSDMNFELELKATLEDKTLSKKDFDHILNSVTGEAMDREFRVDGIGSDSRYLLIDTLSHVKGLPAEEQKAVNQKLDTLSADLEKRMDGISNAKDKLFVEEYMVFLNLDTGSLDKAREIDLPQEQVAEELKYLHEKFDRQLEDKAKTASN